METIDYLISLAVRWICLGWNPTVIHGTVEKKKIVFPETFLRERGT